MKTLFMAALISFIGFSANAQTATKKAVTAKKPETTTIKKPTSAKNPAIKPAGNLTSKTLTFKSNLDSASYALGVNVASKLQIRRLKYH